MARLINWNPDNPRLWQKYSVAAYKNLWLSSAVLICGFAVWMQWSVISVQMLQLGFPFTTPQLFSLTAIAGLSGALLRVPASFFAGLYEGKQSLVVLAVMLLVPVLVTAWALQHPETPLLIFQLLALLSGLGGAVFSVSMANVSQFFPHQHQGFVLGLHAGVGNLGIVVVQIITPVAASAIGLHWLGWDPSPMQQLPTNTLTGNGPSGDLRWLQNAGFIWLLILIPLLLALVRWLDTVVLVADSAQRPRWRHAFTGILSMVLVTLFATGICMFALLPKEANGAGILLSKELVLVSVLIAVLAALRCMPILGDRLSRQFQVFNNKHSWLMALMYAMSFGTLVGFASAFPLFVQFIFGYTHHWLGNSWVSELNPNSPSVLMYSWVGPLLAIMSRPMGGWLGDRYGGARVTQWCALTLCLASVWGAWIVHQAFASRTPETHFVTFFICMLLIFIASGLANGSAFRSVTALFPRSQVSTVIGWVSAVGACGAFYVPQAIGEHLQSATPATAMIGFALFYGICAVVNQFFYLSRQAEHFNP